MAKLHILLVEDNPADVDLIHEFFEGGKIHNDMDVVKDGVEALAYLRRQDKYSQATRPALILLDLNMPKKCGLEVLAEIRQDPMLSNIPVVVVTTSREDSDMTRAHSLKANYYLCKPLDVVQLFRMIQAIDSLGLEIIERPQTVIGSEPQPQVESAGVRSGKSSARNETESGNTAIKRGSGSFFSPRSESSRVTIEDCEAQYLYKSDDVFTFMDSVDFHKFEVPAEVLGDKVDFLKHFLEGIRMQRCQGKIIDVQLPAVVELEVVACSSEPPTEINSQFTKRVTVESGAEFLVPLHVKVGDRVMLDTATRTVL